MSFFLSVVAPFLVSFLTVNPKVVAQTQIDAVRVPFGAVPPRQIVLSNDVFRGQSSQAFLQAGFDFGEMAGVWVRVPNNVALFKIDAIRILVGEPLVGPRLGRYSVGFQIGVSQATIPRPDIPSALSGAARVVPGWHWNDIPLERWNLPCVAGGGFVGAAIQVTRQGPSGFFRDASTVSRHQANVVRLRPGGWQWASALGVRGNWIIRVTGRAVDSSQCDF